MTAIAGHHPREPRARATSAPSSTGGATLTRDGVRFAAYVTNARSVGVRLFGRAVSTLPMIETSPHHFEIEVKGIGAGTRYKLVLDDREVPDPFARSLPEGVHGPARVEPSPAGARGARTTPFVAPPLHRWVVYEVHVGTFTPEGTYRAAIGKLDALAELGINVIELMPLASFDGQRGWGYDGVALFAPHAAYGTPTELRELVDEAHRRGIAVVLDVVYNHFGPSGNYLPAYAKDYFTSERKNAWGDAPDFRSPHMRALVLDNARYWLEDFDFDGLRLDATHGIFDDSDTHILTELAELAHSLDRPRMLIAEDERNDPALIDVHGLDGVWADDFHHVLRVTMTKEQDGYYAAYRGGAEELARVIERGWLYEGQWSAATNAPRGLPATLPKHRLVYCIQNHDQIGNRALGNRVTGDVEWGAFMGASLLLLFLPSIPLLFMGQEWAASSPFLFFTDFDADLGAKVTRGRREEFKSFGAFQDPALRDAIPDPQASTTFERSKLRWEERDQLAHAATLALYKTMLHLRATDPVLSAAGGTLRAVAQAGLLVVTRESEAGRRVLVYNPTDRPLADPRLTYGRGRLIASEAVVDGRLPPGAAAIFAEAPQGQSADER